MMNRRGLAGVSVFITLLLGAVSVMADPAAGSAAFIYSEGWAVVSAPPPPGPYQAINLDPRIPGQDSLPLLPAEEQPSNVVSERPLVEIPAEALDNPPAAGAPVLSQMPDSPAARLNAEQAPVPARYNRMMQTPPALNYPSPSRSPVQSGYPGYGNMPPMGYYRTPVRRPSQEEVPPPPAYDAIMNNRRSYGNQGYQGTP
jgi:hypothetical protein